MSDRKLESKLEVNCRHFSGYKPCGLSAECNSSCPSRSLVTSQILVVHLEALGAVLRATSVLPEIKRRFPNCSVTWVTKAPAHKLLENNRLVDRVLTLSNEDLLKLSTLSFDVGFCIDKSLAAYGVIKQTQVDMLFGFKVDSATGSIVPANVEAEELWNIGLNDNLKFHVNKKPETQLMTEALGLDFLRSSYQLFLNEQEQALVEKRRRDWIVGSDVIVGVNTGCSSVLPYKKMSVHSHRQLIKELLGLPRVKVVLLGGPEDTERNQQIAYGLPVVSSPTGAGLRDGLCSVAACDVVFSGDSLGMHMAIALGKWVVAWFGPTCAHEIDLYDRGVKLEAKVPCGPCWKRACDRKTMCYDRVDLLEAVSAVKKGIQWQTSSYRQPSSEISF